MSLLDVDMDYIKSIASLHCFDCLSTDDPSAIQISLEEAIKTKIGKAVDLSTVIASSVKLRAEELKIVSRSIEESKTNSSSDNELELDLLKEDLMCIICKEMDVGARNQLLECCNCHSLYHQECHRPIVSSQDADINWMCQSCKSSSAFLSSNSASKSMIAGSSSESQNYKTAVIKTGMKRPGSPSKSLTSKQTNIQISSGNVMRSSSTPNISIISAEKKIQIMKKKAAAKQHEKRKLPK